MQAEALPPSPAPAHGRARSVGLLAVTGLCAAALLLSGAAGELAWQGNRFTHGSGEALPDGKFALYVGYDPVAFSPQKDYDASRVAQAVADWREAHPTLRVVAEKPVHVAGLIVGYTLVIDMSGDARPKLKDDYSALDAPTDERPPDDVPA